jgi:hypothetical protein
MSSKKIPNGPPINPTTDPSQPEPDFSFAYSSTTIIKAKGNGACNRAFVVSLVIATGRWIVWPFVVLAIALYRSDLSIIEPLLRRGIAFVSMLP